MVDRAFRCTSIAIDWHSCRARRDFVDLVDGRSSSAASTPGNRREALQPERFCHAASEGRPIRGRWRRRRQSREDSGLERGIASDCRQTTRPARSCAEESGSVVDRDSHHRCSSNRPPCAADAVESRRSEWSYRPSISRPREKWRDRHWREWRCWAQQGTWSRG